MSYLALAPDHPLVRAWAAGDAGLQRFLDETLRRSERERMQERHPRGYATGRYALHPYTGERLPIWVASYVLVQYGTGAVMGVPAHDARDHAFAQHYKLPILPVFGGGDPLAQAHDTAEGTLINSGVLNGLDVPTATQHLLQALAGRGLGARQVQYRWRDAAFGRQRYWGEPIPIYYKAGLPYALQPEDLPLELPDIADYKPTAEGAPPLARAPGWKTREGYPLETTTMPGWAGSSWYFLRYLDPHNDQEPFSPEAVARWGPVDLYVGGKEHATGHLLYARFFTHFLYDRGYLPFKEPFRKLLNQGMIHGVSQFVYRVKGTQQLVSHGLREGYETTRVRVEARLVQDGVLDIEALRRWRSDFAGATFLLEEGKYYCGSEVEKMSKSKYNTVAPEEVVGRYGADALRLYLLFLGPISQDKPWNTHGIEGSYKFLARLWRHLHDAQGTFAVVDAAPTAQESKVLHMAIKEVREAIERHSFNTGVSALMSGLNGLLRLACRKRAVWSDFVRLLGPWAPHVAEELWERLGHAPGSLLQAGFPQHDAVWLRSETVCYPLAVNGKVRAQHTVAADASAEVLRQAALEAPELQRWLEGRTVRKVVVVPGRMINVVVS